MIRRWTQVPCGLYLGNILLERGRFAEAERELNGASRLGRNNRRMPRTSRVVGKLP